LKETKAPKKAKKETNSSYLSALAFNNALTFFARGTSSVAITVTVSVVLLLLLLGQRPRHARTRLRDGLGPLVVDLDGAREALLLVPWTRDKLHLLEPHLAD
jgi:hypothetical protein